jgi:hypothetical protein
MHQSEIDRLRKAIRRSYGSSPHKKKYWLALLEDHAGALSQPNLGGPADPSADDVPPRRVAAASVLPAVMSAAVPAKPGRGRVAAGPRTPRLPAHPALIPLGALPKPATPSGEAATRPKRTSLK